MRGGRKMQSGKRKRYHVTGIAQCPGTRTEVDAYTWALSRGQAALQVLRATEERMGLEKNSLFWDDRYEAYPC